MKNFCATCSGEPFEVDIIRDEIKIKSVRSRLYETIGYIRITTFSEQTSPGLQKAIDDLQAGTAEGLTGLVLDLRNNPEDCCLKRSVCLMPFWKKARSSQQGAEVRMIFSMLMRR